MIKLNPYPNPFTKYIDQLPSLISTAFCQLLGNKHLYQKIEIDVKELMTLVKKMAGSSTDIERMQAKHMLEVLDWKWHIESKMTTESKRYNTEVLLFALPTIKIFCSTCNRIEPFNAYPSDSHAIINHNVTDKSQQLFILEYECQSCKGMPAVFMVKRDKLKLVLEGRSPIEHVEVPTVIPKEQRKFYSDAIVAHNSGQTLAGLFLLRTLIEQYVRSQSDAPNLPADKLVENYTAQLPVDFKDRFPSFGKIYSNLSVAIHKANASVTLFDKSITELIEHFDAKKLFKLLDKTRSNE